MIPHQVSVGPHHERGTLLPKSPASAWANSAALWPDTGPTRNRLVAAKAAMSFRRLLVGRGLLRGSGLSGSQNRPHMRLLIGHLYMAEPLPRTTRISWSARTAAKGRLATAPTSRDDPDATRTEALAIDRWAQESTCPPSQPVAAAPAATPPASAKGGRGDLRVAVGARVLLQVAANADQAMPPRNQRLEPAWAVANCSRKCFNCRSRSAAASLSTGSPDRSWSHVSSP